MDKLQENFNKLLLNLDNRFNRYMYHKIEWSGRMIGLTGPRGVGKTTMVLQYIKANLNRAETLYVTAEDLYFIENSLVDLADRFVKLGGKHLIIDEIHKYKEWARELKLIYDYNPNLQIIFTGSSILDINRGAYDLSRRAVMYNMQGLSYREFLELFHNIKLPQYTLNDILEHRVVFPTDFHPLAHFANYLRYGYYPFSLDTDFDSRIQQVINQTIENDIPLYADINTSTARKLKQLLAIISRSVPFKPNITSISVAIGASRGSILDYLLYIEEAGMISQLRNGTEGIKSLGKVDKIYLDNTNLIYALGMEQSNIGNVRETLFMNQTRVNYSVITSSVSDFEIDGITFEVGGKNKKQRQIAGLERAYIVKDDIEQGYLNVIPLWMLGLLY